VTLNINVINYGNTGITGSAQGYIGRFAALSPGEFISLESPADIIAALAEPVERAGAAVAQRNLAIGSLQRATDIACCVSCVYHRMPRLQVHYLAVYRTADLDLRIGGGDIAR